MTRWIRGCKGYQPTFPGIKWSYCHEHYFDAILRVFAIHKFHFPALILQTASCGLNFQWMLFLRIRAVLFCLQETLPELKWQLKRTAKESPSRKVKRQAASSRAKLTYTSPASYETECFDGVMYWQEEVGKVIKTKVIIANEQHIQLCDMVNVIDGTVGDNLQTLKKGRLLVLVASLEKIGWQMKHTIIQYTTSSKKWLAIH